MDFFDSMKNSLKQFLIGIVAFFSLVLYAYTFNWQTRDIVKQWLYDISHQNWDMYNEKDMYEFLNGMLTKANYSSLDEEYLEYTNSNSSPFNEMLKNGEFRIIKRSHLYQKIAYHHRVKDFMCKDKYYKELILGKRDSILWLIDPNVVLKTIELMDAIEALGHNPKAFEIRNGHRHPLYNKQVGGASQSRHIKGEAVDISVGDIDQNGKKEQTDKQIILDLLEEEIIKDQGGIGKYPGTMSVHYDVRGYKARWDSF